MKSEMTLTIAILITSLAILAIEVSKALIF